MKEIRRIGVDYVGGNGDQPIMTINGFSLPDAWQNAMFALREYGLDVPTSFDREGDPPSKDATVTVIVWAPFAEPRISKRFPGSLEALEHYRLEVVAGVHDHWVSRFGDEWNYSYHERLRKYDVGDRKKIDQIENMLNFIEKRFKEKGDSD